LKRAEKLRDEIEMRGVLSIYSPKKRLQDRTKAEFSRLQSELVKQRDLLLPSADEAVGEGPHPSSGPEILERKVEESRRGPSRVLAYWQVWT